MVAGRHRWDDRAHRARRHVVDHERVDGALLAGKAEAHAPSGQPSTAPVGPSDARSSAAARSEREIGGAVGPGGGDRRARGGGHDGGGGRWRRDPAGAPGNITDGQPDGQVSMRCPSDDARHESEVGRLARPDDRGIGNGRVIRGATGRRGCVGCREWYQPPQHPRRAGEGGEHEGPEPEETAHRHDAGW